MPELPDIQLYLETLEPRIVGDVLRAIRVTSPFVLRSVDPPPSSLEGQAVRALSRLGKRLVIGFDDELYLILHLMIAGRLRWREPNAKSAAPPRVPPRTILARFDFSAGTLFLTEVGSRKRASMFIVRGVSALEQHNPGGLEVLEADLAAFTRAIMRENHTLKRALTDPRLFSGIGNAYSDEILHCARLSPVKLTRSLTTAEVARLHEATRSTLTDWIARLREECGARFPEKVTAFREGMAAHGRFGRPCPVCGSPIQRIVYASNEANYCARCQTDGRLLADRSLSRLLRQDWPRTLEDWEARRLRNQLER